MKAIIFDFNGTMFKDTMIQFETWSHFVKKRLNMDLSWEDFANKVCGPQVRDIFPALLGRPVSSEEIAAFADEKERIYREACLAQPGGMHLTEGLEEALDALKAKGIPLTVASGSPEINLRFYWQQFELDRWFRWEQLVCDNGTLPGKPDPAMYLRASEKIGYAPKDCVVVEDAISGVLSAQRAGIGRVYLITGTMTEAEASAVPGVAGVLKTFEGFDMLFND